MNSQQKNSKLLFEKIVPLTNENPRLVSQQGLFLKIPLDCSVEQLIDDYENKERGGAFYKIIFDDTFKDEALLVLQNMNITQLTLFPDLIGSALHSNFQFEIQPYIIATKKKIWDDFDARNKKK